MSGWLNLPNKLTTLDDYVNKITLSGDQDEQDDKKRMLELFGELLASSSNNKDMWVTFEGKLFDLSSDMDYLVEHMNIGSYPINSYNNTLEYFNSLTSPFEVAWFAFLGHGIGDWINTMNYFKLN